MADEEREDEDAECDGCGKTAPCDEDDEAPAGWWSLFAEHARDDGAVEEDSALICSPDCARLWLAGWNE